MAAQFAVGYELDQKYRIEKTLGAGCFGVVFLATDLKIGRRVAVKILHENVATIERFVNEVEAIKRLEHDNIVRLYDIGWSNEMQLYMVTEYVEGVDLLKLIETEERISLRRTAAMGLQILDALAEAHKLSIIHCDLKPDNILITQKGVRTDIVKVLDFGVSKLLSRGQTARGGMMSGTPLYMAPEQVMGTEIGAWTDLYAIGLILYEMVIGEPAMAAATAEEVLKRQVQDRLILPSGLVGTELGAIIERACAKSPQERYTSAELMYRDVKVAMESGATRPDWGTLNSAQVGELSKSLGAFDPLNGSAVAYDANPRDSALAPSASPVLERDILAPTRSEPDFGDDEPVDLGSAGVLGAPLGVTEPAPRVPPARVAVEPSATNPGRSAAPNMASKPAAAPLELDSVRAPGGVTTKPVPKAPLRPTPIHRAQGSGKIKIFVAVVALAAVVLVAVFVFGLREQQQEQAQVEEAKPEPVALVLESELRTELFQAHLNGAAHATGMGWLYAFEARFVVLSIPVGAKIQLDGEDMGVSPVELSLSTRKRSTIGVTLKGYKPAQLEVEPKKLPPRQPIRVVLQR